MEAKNWGNKIGKHVKSIRDNQRKVRMYQELKEAGHKVWPALIPNLEEVII